MAGRQRQLYFILGGLSLLLLTGAAAYFYTQGTLLSDTDCTWEHVPHPPNQAAHFDSVDEFVSAFAAANDEVAEDSLQEKNEFRKRDGRIEYRSCPVNQ